MFISRTTELWKRGVYTGHKEKKHPGQTGMLFRLRKSVSIFVFWV